ncbi:MAG: hypothetical protein AAF086_08415, partial [Planctomycetota bacterium]
MYRLSIIAAATLAFLIATPPFVIADPGHVQVRGEAGINVFIDSDFKGTTTAEQGGLIITNVPSGMRTLLFTKDGFRGQEDAVDIESGRVYVYDISPFRPIVKVEQEGDVNDAVIQQEVGSLQISTLPVECKITIDKLGIMPDRNGAKNQEIWRLPEVPAGNYDIIFSAIGKRLIASVQIDGNSQIELFVNFVTGEIEQKDGSKIDFWRNELIKNANKRIRDKIENSRQYGSTGR